MNFPQCEGAAIPGHDIIVIGASAGGVQALSEVVAGLPPDLPSAVLVVLHVAPYPSSVLPSILSRNGRLPALHPEDGAALLPGRVYVAPSDRHLVVEKGRVCINRGPRENGHRPAVDVLFRTAARTYRNRVVGVVLTGNLDDGTAGLAAIKSHGGVAIVQNPEEADYPGMPTSAVTNVAVDHVVPLSAIAPLLVQWAREGGGGARQRRDRTRSCASHPHPPASGAVAEPGVGISPPLQETKTGARRPPLVFL